MDAIQVGFVVRNSGLDAARAVRTLPHVAETLGYSTVWVTDHIIGSRSFLPVYEPEWAEALTALAYIAATTTRIRLGIGVLVVPYRDPVYAAKVLATVDNLSDGRLTVGIGAGWSKAEFGALGVFRHFDRRGSVTDESVDLMMRCWEGGEFDWQGEHFPRRTMTFGPLPTQHPRPPIWVGGQSMPALRRAARVADTWHPTNIPPEEVGRLGAIVDGLAGRALPRAIRLSIHSDEIDSMPDRLAAYAAAGCVEAAIGLRDHGFEASRDNIERLARRAGLV